ncbi:peptidoglycan editing factor PgeF [uncultured Ilyobacter sp.]|uniref:peptidoglycan editing factor PgeF n=1 Tax=uncultured Ilyobacter sp. TaxID=544433 RepID=UPI0029C97BD4|nr:peptidoglycan editing factor PgeF [uncultured Ilyobacter sp.]
MYIERDGYFEIEEFGNAGIGAIFTGKKIGDVKEMFVLSPEKEKNIEEFMKKNSIDGKKLVAARQTHSKNIVNIRVGSPLYFDDVDGFVTDRRDLVLFTVHADCLPIYFYDVEKKVIGLCHSGWKGSFLQIGEEVLKNMKENYGSQEKDILVGIGIGAGSCCYQVGDDFYKEFKERFPSEIVEASFHRKADGWYFDNGKFNCEMLIKSGIIRENIVNSQECTVCNEGLHSYRREGKDAGRNGAFIYFKN